MGIFPLCSPHITQPDVKTVLKTLQHCTCNTVSEFRYHYCCEQGLAVYLCSMWKLLVGTSVFLSISIKLSFSRASLILRFSWKKSLLFTENSRYPSVLQAIWHVCINILKLYLIILSIHIQLGTLLKNFGKDSSSSKKYYLCSLIQKLLLGLATPFQEPGGVQLDNELNEMEKEYI